MRVGPGVRKTVVSVRLDGYDILAVFSGPEWFPAGNSFRTELMCDGLHSIRRPRLSREFVSVRCLHFRLGAPVGTDSSVSTSTSWQPSRSCGWLPDCRPFGTHAGHTRESAFIVNWACSLTNSSTP